jgi:hypothetical protein
LTPKIALSYKSDRFEALCLELDAPVTDNLKGLLL